MRAYALGRFRGAGRQLKQSPAGVKALSRQPPGGCRPGFVFKTSALAHARDQLDEKTFFL
jgi:hypothetical protein